MDIALEPSIFIVAPTSGSPVLASVTLPLIPWEKPDRQDKRRNTNNGYCLQHLVMVEIMSDEFCAIFA
jgi:hypothetical protein